MKIIYLDLETTGLDPEKNGLIQLSMIIEVDGVVVEEFNEHVQPYEGEIVAAQALKVNGITKEAMLEFQKPEVMFDKFVAALDRHIKRYDKNDKAIIVGYNTDFDLGFLKAFLKKNNFEFEKDGKTIPLITSYIDLPGTIDLLPLMRVLKHLGIVDVYNCRLSSIAEAFKITQENKHDGLSDARTTREIHKLCAKSLKWIPQEAIEAIKSNGLNLKEDLTMFEGV